MSVSVCKFCGTVWTLLQFLQPVLQSLLKLSFNVLSSTNPERPGDLKESFDVGAVYDENFVSSSSSCICNINILCL